MREYEIERRGQVFLVLATEADAKRLGLKPVTAVGPEEQSGEQPDSKKRTPANKQRTPENK